MKRIDYFLPRALLIITGTVFFSQLLLDQSGIIERKPGFEWVLGACAFSFLISVLYAVLAVFVNAYIGWKSNDSKN